MALYFNMTDRNTRRRLSVIEWCSLLSVLMHFGFLVYQIAPTLVHPPELAEKNTPIEIADLPKEYLQPRNAQKQKPPPLNPKEKQMAETEDANNREIDPDAKFLGDHNQKVAKQTKANRVDDFRTKQGTGSKEILKSKEESAPPTGEEVAKNAPDEVVTEGEGIAEETHKKGIKRNWKTLSLKDLSVGGDGGATAATDDRLKGVDSGEGTMLSTREFRFYSYYHRIKELLRQYWKPNVERQIARIWNKGKNINADELTTKVAVLLDEHGKIQKISKVQSSGFTEIDEAAIDAFQRAAPFPNPPKGIVDADGFVRINWDFILQTESGPVIQFRSYGSVPN